MLRSKPQLELGVNLVDNPEGFPVFQSLLDSELTGRRASAVWIDTGNEASTYALGSFSQDLLEKVEIGRAFTPYQHHSLVHQIDEFISEDTEILVLPNVSMLYRELSDWEAEELFRETWEKVIELQEEHELKILVSMEGDFGPHCLIHRDVEKRIEVEETGRGWMYSGSFDQMFFRDGACLQTTMNYWRR